MSLNEDSFSPLIRRSLEKISNLLGKQTINIDFLFDEQVLVKKYYVSSESKERSLNATTSLERDWIHMFQTFKILSSLHFVCLRHQHQWIEFFSIMKNMCSDDSSKTLEQNVIALLTHKINVSNSVFLKKMFWHKNDD